MRSPEGLEIAPVVRHPTTGKVCQPSSKWVLFSNQKDKAAKGGDGFYLSSVTKVSGPLTPSVPTAIRPWETFTFLRIHAYDPNFLESHFDQT